MNIGVCLTDIDYVILFDDLGEMHTFIDCQTLKDL